MFIKRPALNLNKYIERIESGKAPVREIKWVECKYKKTNIALWRERGNYKCTSVNVPTAEATSTPAKNATVLTIL